MDDATTFKGPHGYPKISPPVLTNTDGSDITITPGKQSRKRPVLMNIDGTPWKKSRKRRDGSSLRKAPQAPKRFKSSYILFFMEKQEKIKSELPEGSLVGDVSKKSSELWKKLSTDERALWDARAEKDKQRFMNEKAAYTGPWQIPWKRAKKDPSAPKRPMSAFLYFSQDRRGQLKVKNPAMRNTEISSILGKLWRDATDEERRPYVDRELCDRNKYKTVLATWKVEDALRKKEMLKRKVEMAEQQQQQQKQQQEQQQQQQDIQESYHQQHYPAMPDPYYRSYYQQQQSNHPGPNSPTTAGNSSLSESYSTFMPPNFQGSSVEARRAQMSGAFDPNNPYLPSYSNPNIQHNPEGSHSNSRLYQLPTSSAEHMAHNNSMMQAQRLGGMNLSQLTQEDQQQHASLQQQVQQQEQHHLALRNQMLSLHSRKAKK